jgi:predicted tellurium resistance membrane protein TerC
MDTFISPSGALALMTLTFLEIVLGVDNVIFISILSSKLPESQQGQARRMGLLFAMVTRILLLLFLVWIIKLTAPLFYILGRPFSGRDLILIGGGLFLLAKGTIEIHESLEGEEGHRSARVRPSFAAVIIQIVLLDIVFSAGFSHNSRWHGRRNRHHGYGRDSGCRRDDFFSRADQLLR